MKKVHVIPNRFVDSVTLMGLAEKLMQCEGVRGAESGMGTRANVELLLSQGYTVPEGTGKNDLMIAVDAADEASWSAASSFGVQSLSSRSHGQPRQYTDLEEVPSGAYDVAQISLPGRYAVPQIKKALRLGMDAFVFSDNVSLEDELACKQLGRELGRLVMGPDAGVGLLGGVALAAGSIVRRGGIGIVGASGSGAQEVACLIERLGAGVSAIIGTGGHDLFPEIGGITMEMGMQRLEADADTKVICLVSKLADEGVMAQMLTVADRLCKPVVAVFLGGGEALFHGRKSHGATTLQEAAEISYELLTGEPKKLGWTTEEREALAQTLLERIAPERRYFRGLYCGGTFAEEGMLLLAREAPDVLLRSNLHTRYTRSLASPMKSEGHSLLDLGAEDFTAAAPHPVFDPALRLRRLKEELADDQVAVVLLDFITGPGVHGDSILPFVPVIREHPEVLFITAICGAEADPQNIRRARAELEQAGAVVAESNAQSAMLAALLLQALKGRA